MNFTKAFAVFMQIDSKEFTEDEKYEAIQQVLDGTKAQNEKICGMSSKESEVVKRQQKNSIQ
jgi:hypothetical protein